MRPAAELRGNCAGIARDHVRLIAEIGRFLRFPGKRIRREMRRNCAAAAFALAACQHAPEARVETVEVKVPVAVQPIKPSDVPTPPQPLGPRPATAQQAADAAFAGWCAAVAYIDRAVPLLNVSAGLPPIQAPEYPECKKR